MKVLILSSSDCGGAGIAALRLHKALMSYGIDSSMLCFYKGTDTNQVYQVKKKLSVKILEKLPIIYRNNKYRKDVHSLLLKGTFEICSFPEAIYDISNHPLIKQADIINLHWIGNHLNYKLFFRNVRKPIVWTLHDMNPFLGISHYFGDRDSNPLFLGLEEKVRMLKNEAISQHPNVSVVNLCQWMKEYSEKSETFANRTHTIIPNSIDTNIFRAYDKKEARTGLNLPLDKPILLFVSQSVENRRKGFDLLQDTLKNLHRDCVLLVVGEATAELKSIDNSLFVGAINDERRMAMLYAAADAFILPSREDNLPNTMVESLCCGTPVISFSNGGMRDHIRTLENGVLVEQMNSDSLLEGINLFLDNIQKFDRYGISEKAHAIFSPELQAKRYMDFFSSIKG
ncbi:MAG: glycosyltransferase [Alistipes sp.]|nr:glycosyltransferase [Alistipes sp.]